MKENSEREWLFAPRIERPKACKEGLQSCGRGSVFPRSLHQGAWRPLVGALLILLLSSSFHPLEGRSKKDKFHGTVVAAGPKAITVKSRDNIYKVRTFNYSAELEKKIPRKNLLPGTNVTVHYIRGTDQAVKVD